MFGDAQLRAGGQADDALVRQVVNGKQGRGALPAPVHIGRRQPGWPVVGMDQVRAPVDLRKVGGDVGRGQAQAGEANVVVGPVATVVGTVGGAFAGKEFRADQDVDHQAVGHVHAPDLAGRQRCVAAQFADDVDRIAAVHHLRITGDQHPDIMQPGHGPGQCGGDIAQAAGLYQVGDFRGDEQYFLAVGILSNDGEQCLAAGGQHRCRWRFGRGR